VDYQSWESEVPDTITGDILWKVQVYRLALYAADIGWYDVTKLGQDHRTINKIIRLLLTTIPKKRGRTLREEHTPYSTLPEDIDLESLLKNIPF